MNNKINILGTPTLVKIRHIEVISKVEGSDTTLEDLKMMDLK